MKGKVMRISGSFARISPLIIMLALYSYAFGRAPSFYLSPGLDPGGDLAWQSAVKGTFTEFDLDGFTGHVDTLVAGGIIIDVGLGGRTVYSSSSVKSKAMINSGTYGHNLYCRNEYGTVHGAALLNHWDSLDHSQITLDFSQPVFGAGLWVFDDSSRYRESSRMIVTDGNNDVWHSPILEAGNLKTHGVEGFIGVTSPAGVKAIAIENLDEIYKKPFAKAFEVDHIQVSKVLSHYQPHTDEGCECVDPPADMVAWWPFDESDSGGVLTADLAGAVNNRGELIGGAGRRPSKVENFLDLDGIDGYVRVQDHPELDYDEDDDFTFDAWVMLDPDHNTGIRTIIDKRFADHSTTTRGYTVFLYNGCLAFQMADGGGTWDCSRSCSSCWNYVTSANIADGQWHFIAITVDRDNPNGLVFYDNMTRVDGSYDPTLIRGSLANDHDLWIGRHVFWDDRYLQGKLDEIELFKRTLTRDELWEIYEAGECGKCKDDMKDRPIPVPNPLPIDGQEDVPLDTRLTWESGSTAVANHVYFGTDWEDVNAATISHPRGVLVSDGEVTNEYDHGRLAYGQTYYWRVDEVSDADDFSVKKSEVLSFITDFYSYPVTNVTATASSAMPTMNAENTIDGSGLDAEDLHSTNATTMWLTHGTDSERWIQYEFDKPQKLHEMWVWNQNQAVESFIGLGCQSMTIETSLDGVTWKPLDDVPEIAQAPGMPNYAHNTIVDFDETTARYVKLTVHKGYGPTPQVGLSEVRFYGEPVYPRYPRPMDGARVYCLNPDLTWRAGRDATMHEVILSNDRNAVEAGIALVDSVTESRFTPVGLSYGMEYFWRIHEVSTIPEIPLYEGDIWSFKTPEYLVIDDFEMYADEPFLEIWSFWIDGYEVDDNGSLVGNGNAAETEVVYQSWQSMPIHYDNSSAACSEVTRTFSPPLDWNKGAPTTLSLHVRGDAHPDNDAAPMYLVVTDSNGREKRISHPDPSATISTTWTPWQIPLAGMGSLNLASIEKITIGVGKPGGAPSGAQGTVYIDLIEIGTPAW